MEASSFHADRGAGRARRGSLPLSFKTPVGRMKTSGGEAEATSTSHNRTGGITLDTGHRLRRAWPSGSQMLVSLLIAVAGVIASQSLDQVDQDLRIMYTEYTLTATDLGHVSADLMRYRNTLIRALEAPARKEYERITASLPDQRARIDSAVVRYAAASGRVSRSGRSDVQDLLALRESLGAYFSAADATVTLLKQSWEASSPQEAALLKTKAHLQAADIAGQKLIDVSLALDRLLETVAEVAKDLQEKGTRVTRRASTVLILSSLLLAVLVLFGQRVPTAPASGAVSAKPEIERRAPSPMLSPAEDNQAEKLSHPKL